MSGAQGLDQQHTQRHKSDVLHGWDISLHLTLQEEKREAPWISCLSGEKLYPSLSGLWSQAMSNQVLLEGASILASQDGRQSSITVSGFLAPTWTVQTRILPKIQLSDASLSRGKTGCVCLEQIWSTMREGGDRLIVLWAWCLLGSRLTSHILPSWPRQTHGGCTLPSGYRNLKGPRQEKKFRISSQQLQPYRSCSQGS